MLVYPSIYPQGRAANEKHVKKCMSPHFPHPSSLGYDDVLYREEKKKSMDIYMEKTDKNTCLKFKKTTSVGYLLTIPSQIM